MHSTMALAASLLHLAAVGPAVAPNPRTPPSPEEIAAARSAADRLVADAHADDLFENITTGRGPTVRHRASGLYCSFSEKSVGRILIPSSADRGDRVACEERFEYWATTVSARRAPADVTAEQELAVEVQSDRSAHPDLEPSRQPSDPVPSNMLHRAPADSDLWLRSKDGKVTVHWVGRKQNGWIYLVRFITPTKLYPLMATVGLIGSIDDVLCTPERGRSVCRP